MPSSSFKKSNLKTNSSAAKRNSKNIKNDFITTLQELEANPGYYSASNLHDMNREAEAPLISELLKSGKYYVPSYLTLYGQNNEDEDTTTDEEEDEEEKENIIITIMPLGNCSEKIIDTTIFDTMLDAAVEQGQEGKEEREEKKRIKKKMTKKTGEKLKIKKKKTKMTKKK
jgi:hypothetical protein